MKRRRNAPISKRDKKALKRILRSHKGRGNSCRNPSAYRSDLVPRSKSGRAAYKRRLKQMSPSARRAMILALANPKRGRKHRGGKLKSRRPSSSKRRWLTPFRENPKRYSRQKRKSTKGRSLRKFKRALTRKLHHQGSGKGFQQSRRFSKWFTGAARSGQRVTRDAMRSRDYVRRDLIKAWRALPRANPKRRKYGSAETRYHAKVKRATKHMRRLARFDMHGKNRRRNKWARAYSRALHQAGKAIKGEDRSNPHALSDRTSAKVKRAYKNRWRNSSTKAHRGSRRGRSKWANAIKRTERRARRERWNETNGRAPSKWANPKRAKGRKTRRHGKAYTIAAKRGKQFFQVTGSWKSARRHARPFSKKRGWKSERRSHALVWNTREDRSVFDRRGRWRKPPF